MHFQESIKAASGDSRQLFSIVMGLLGRKKTNPMPEGKTEVELAEGFADYFLSKIKKNHGLIRGCSKVPAQRQC